MEKRQNRYRSFVEEDAALRRRGISALEIIIAVLIIGIMTGLAAPRFARVVSRQRADAAARRIAVDLELARRSATMSSSSRTVVFDPVAETYTLAEVDAFDRPTTTYVVRLGDDPHRADLVSADLGGDVEITFNGYGLPDTGGSVVVQVGGEQRTITVSPETGKARVE